MRKYPLPICLLLLGLLICACASKTLPLLGLKFEKAASNVTATDWKFEKAAINFTITADDLLNLDEDIPHTLSLCVYQLKDWNRFNRIADNHKGLYKLMECNRFDSSVTSVKRLIVNPGQTLDFSLDRAEGTQYVAIVAGYYLLEKQRMIRFYKVPVREYKKGLIMKKKFQIPAVMNIILNLGPKQIMN